MELNASANDKFLNAEIDVDKLEEMKKSYDSSSEKIFSTTWDLTEDQNIHLETDNRNSDKISKSRYKVLSELDIQNISSEEEDSSVDTVINNIKEEDQDDLATVVPCPPILGGQVYKSNHL